MFNFVGEITGTEFISAGLALILVLILSLSLHEFAHAFIAYKQGDPTPKLMGRVTINPLKHIEPIGFITCFLFGFGWAKPVQINPVNFKNYRAGMFLTSIAGVTVNIILSIIGCGIYVLVEKYLLFMDINFFTMFLFYFSQFLYLINLSLFIFNLLPVYPLDGFNCISAVSRYDNKFVNFMRRYGSIILICILLFGDVLFVNLTKWIGTPIELLWRLIIG